jgi:hypothetical protein
MYNENIKSVVDYAFQDDAVKMRDALYNEINDKIFDAIEQRKQQLAQNLVNQYDSQEQEQEEE